MKVPGLIKKASELSVTSSVEAKMASNLIFSVFDYNFSMGIIIRQNLILVLLRKNASLLSLGEKVIMHYYGSKNPNIKVIFTRKI
jgi:hypothetical protein